MNFGPTRSTTAWSSQHPVCFRRGATLFWLAAFVALSGSVAAQASGESSAAPTQKQKSEETPTAPRRAAKAGEPYNKITIDPHESTHQYIAQGRAAGTLNPHGHSRLTGLLQVWGTSGFGDRLNGGDRAGGYANPPGRSYKGGFGDPLRLRRTQIALDGYFNPRLDYRIMIDPARIDQAPGSAEQDIWLGYEIAPGFRIEAGQQKTGLSEEGTRGNGQLLTVERSIMNSLPLKVGRIGNVRDIGLALRYNRGPFSALIGYWDDNGVDQSRFDKIDLKFLTGNIYYTGIRHIIVGVWGGTNIRGPKPAEARERGGGTFLYQSGPHTFEAEVAYARDYAAGAPAPGRNGTISRLGYLLYAHTLSRQWQLVGRYENADPAHQGTFTGVATTANGITIQPGDHKLKEYTLGFTYYLVRQKAKIQLNIVREDAEINARSFFGKPRTLLLTNYQMRF